MGIFLGVAKISNIILGCLNFLIFLGCLIDAGPEPTYEVKMRVSPLGFSLDHCMDGAQCRFRWGV